jgi:hypothetical protein
VPTSFYDVVVLGAHPEPLLCAALCSRAGLRVLVLGQGVPESSYKLGDVVVEPYAFTLVGRQSPIVQRTLEALTLKQDVRQRLLDRGAPFQLLLPEHRIDVHPETDRWLYELSRAFPDARTQAADITRTLGEVRGELDAVVERDLVWPPETFIERQQFSLTTTAQRYDRQGHGWASWHQLPTRHPLRTAFDGLLPHLSGLLPAQHSDATRARLAGHVLDGVSELHGGWTWFRDALIDRIRSWGSDVRLHDRATSIHHEGRRGHTIRIMRTDEEVGCSQIAHGMPVAELSQLLAERGTMAPMFERVGEPRSRSYRCAVHVCVRREVIPERLGSLALLCTSNTDPARAFWLEARTIDGDRTLLTVHRMIDEDLIDTGSSPLHFVRTEALNALRGIIPFFDEHALWIDSPHDGLPPSPLADGVDLTCSDPWTRGPSTMRAIYEYPTRRALGVCALPTRTPVRGIFLCNQQVSPGLGFEGSFLVANSVARIIGSQYRRKDWLRRAPWARRV